MERTVVVNNLIIVLMAAALAIALSGCSTTKQFVPQTTVRVVTSTVYPHLAPISIPNSPALKPIQFDLPRQTELSQIVRNTTACIGVPVEKQDIAFWDECGIYPVDPDSNLFIGLDQTNFNNLQFNLETLRQHNLLLISRIELGNSQREEFERLAGRKPPTK